MNSEIAGSILTVFPIKRAYLIPVKLTHLKQQREQHNQCIVTPLLEQSEVKLDTADMGRSSECLM